MYKFKPILKTLVWGTESWVLSGVPGNESIVAEGPSVGLSIRDIYPGEFPLLIKFIDAKSDLSIQVHPNDEVARERHGCKGKTEMWYIIGASEGAHLLSGLSRKISPDEYASLVESGQIVSALASYDVAPGDVFFLPAGRIHAIGGGCYLAEIQETSDITYRIYDYGRLGLDGKPRQLHTEQARDVIDYSVSDDYRTHYTLHKNEPSQLVSCEHFKTDLLDIDKRITLGLEGCGEFLIVIAMEGEARIEAGESDLHLSPGECVLVPKDDRSIAITPLGASAHLMTTFVP